MELDGVEEWFNGDMLRYNEIYRYIYIYINNNKNMLWYSAVQIFVAVDV